MSSLLLACGPSDSAPTERKEAPDFEHVDLEGNPVRLSALRGKTVVIDFWATWCPPCVFQPASVEEIRDWAEENDAVARYPILRGADEDLARRFGAMGFPAMVIVAPDGRIGSVHMGLSSAEEVEESVAAVSLEAQS
jgi:thiol-disulfide isomerase/thioredoxin